MRHFVLKMQRIGLAIIKRQTPVPIYPYLISMPIRLPIFVFTVQRTYDSNGSPLVEFTPKNDTNTSLHQTNEKENSIKQRKRDVKI